MGAHNHIANQNGSGMNVSGGINNRCDTVNTIYLIEGSNQLLWLPSVSLGWSETLWGDITNISRNGSVHSEDQSEGSGFVSFAITAILNDYFADISLSQSTGSGEGRNSIAFQLGVDF